MFNFFSKKISAVFSWIIISSCCLFSVVFCFAQYEVVSAEIDGLAASDLFSQIIIPEPVPEISRFKAEPIKVKGLYLTAYSAGSSKKLTQIIDLIEKTELNAIVIDVKDYSGYILYDSKLPLAEKLGLRDKRIKNIGDTLKMLREHNIYTIARVSVFQDPLLAVKKPEWAIQSKKGGLWRDRNKLAWVDPSNPEVWKHVVSVAKEAADLGFDEINFDYIRFPTDGSLSDIVYSNGAQTRYEVIGDFFSYVEEQMQDEPVYISADLFGLTTEKKGSDDLHIGQRLADAVDHFDYVMPMVYPSHYPTGYRGYKNPANYPYEVVYNAMKAGVKQAEGKKAKLRAWIQAFNLGAVYDGKKIRAQIQASDDAGADGWVLWNAANRYGEAGLEKE